MLARTTKLGFAAVVFVFGCAGDDGAPVAGTGTTGDQGDATAAADAGTTGSTSLDSADSGATTAANDTGPLPGTDETAGDSGSGTGGDATSGTTGTVATCQGMTFFATSVGSGKDGGNLGGLVGADATCQALAAAVGQGDCTWHAYLSTAAVDARDRIGTGPWENADGDVVAQSVEALHANGLPNGDPNLVVDENAAPIPGNEHDILTGSQADGTLLDNATCLDWTSGDQADQAGVGHSDIPANPMFSPSWNEAHVVPGCRPQDLQMVGGAGRLYCFALTAG